MDIMIKITRAAVLLRLGLAFLLLFFASVSSAGIYTATKDKACPDDWAPTDKTIPVIWPSLSQPESQPWGPVLPGIGTDDKSLAKTHLSTKNPLVTYDLATGTFAVSSSVPSWALISYEPGPADDLLTVASECARTRNLDFDTLEYVAPSAPEPNTDNGWIPAVMY